MFPARRNRNLTEAASAWLELLYHCTVREIRKASGSAAMGLGVVLLQNVAMIAIMYLVYSYFLGLRALAIRGDFMVFLVTGIFFLMTHNRTLNEVMSSGNPISPMMQHAPMTPVIAVAVAALSVLYQQVMTGLIIYAAVHIWKGSFPIDDPAGLILPFLLAWSSGIAVGLIFKGLKPFAPRLVTILSRIYRITNMFTSGKLLPVNYMASNLLAWFIWNPLLHCIDQARGAAFVNYFPRHTNLEYPFWFTAGFVLLGLMADAWLRKNLSLSWMRR
jgi:ABC-type polysaccharide/polyol phosphate export permease